MSKRIINIDNGSPPPPISTMEDLLNSAQEDWKFKRKDEAFIKLLSAIAFISKGVATAMNNAEVLRRELEELRAKLPKE